jgi:hypothetical protein
MGRISRWTALVIVVKHMQLDDKEALFVLVLSRVGAIFQMNHFSAHDCLLVRGSIESRRSDGSAMAHNRSFGIEPRRTRAVDFGQAPHDQRHSLGFSDRCAVARHARTTRQQKFSIRGLHPPEQARRVGRGHRDARRVRAAGQRGGCHRFHDRTGASACRRRKLHEVNPEKLLGDWCTTTPFATTWKPAGSSR